MRHLLIPAALFILTGCQSAAPTNSATSHHASPAQAQIGAGATFKRFAPRYPISAARRGLEGCATIAYTLTPANEIKDVLVIDSSDEVFATEAVTVLPKWNWSVVPAEHLIRPIRLQTRFEFCLQDGSGHCTPEALATGTECRGEDLVISSGSMIKKVSW
ncbi:energy transducer TonB [Alteromonas gilva]|uniref:Energy transducer TonB n=1 Tax=Alteromonas gilva TaxID=2987522 RepID=A0ABT5L2G8_9ALTE|nr:energy transducer TonB [Alteromonas gilva]MDC8831222.1 energy transducer TonB [Alteromonas gilva]